LCPIALLTTSAEYHFDNFISPLQPERIDPKKAGEGYTVKADVWSFGITVVSNVTKLGFIIIFLIWSFLI